MIGETYMSMQDMHEQEPDPPAQKRDPVLLTIRLALWGSLVFYGYILVDMVFYMIAPDGVPIPGLNYMTGLFLVIWFTAIEWLCTSLMRAKRARAATEPA